MLEILAPAGNMASAKAAINNGANAIYLGYSAFSARQSADNFDMSALSEVVTEARLRGVKVYVAMNTAVKTEETELFLKTLLLVWEKGVDAVILQDIFLGKLIKRRYPQIVLHLSTQAGVSNVNGAKLAKEYGFSRVILARETPLSEIEKITPILETEVFVQGALCTAYSGQCYFSSFIGGNSGNRGRCKQPCRKKYYYNRGAGQEFCYALSLSDLSVGEDISKLIKAGVVSFKIEGRMRREEYVAAAVRYYRAILDGADCLSALSDLKRTYNRGNYTKGLAFGQDKRLLSTAVQGHIGEKVGVVKVVNGKFFVESLFRPQTGDAFKILREGNEIGGAFFQKQESRGFTLSSKQRLKNGDSVFITTDNEVNARLLTAERKTGIVLKLYFHEGEPAKVEADGVCVQTEYPLSTAQSHPLTREELISCFSKTDGLPVDVAFSNIEFLGNVFIAKSQLNAFRREFFSAWLEMKTRSDNVSYPYEPLEMHVCDGENNQTAVIASDFENVVCDIAVYKPNDYRENLPKAFLEGDFKRYIYYPPLCTETEEIAIKNRLNEGKIDGIYADNLGGILFAKEQNIKVFVGTGFNLINASSILSLLEEESVAYYAISKEANERECASLTGKKAFALCDGNIKIMDLCYCPFGKTCAKCDKRETYTLTDENGRVFPVRRYVDGRGNCRFEVYNCANLKFDGIKGVGCLMENSVANKQNDYTFGHYKRGVL